MPAAPAPEKRAAMEQKLGELIQRANLGVAAPITRAIENHELWTPPTPNQTLYHVWDFLKRSNFVQLLVRTGAAAAKKVYDDVVGRNMMAQMMVTDTTGKTAMLTGSSGPPVDFGSNAKEKVRSLNSV
ncbi:hypothetical protein VE01_07129 [Pseudogymnoascus verrucosus]|uniref:Uncharacterized protein n=1 Tax=Pseudogymnoascus verrucosus TaxID=342668 RepID=A0A1B8GDU5_9PEZI|nr:uncharacterized protein VE01_07129 [Pseudogymnoascus verrucosus]OBT93999.1 hypothetical protein VE01_07129 [Pseudogymnoascus verrucosus]